MNPQLGSGLGLGLGLGSGLGLDSVRGSTTSHKMKYLPDGRPKANLSAEWNPACQELVSPFEKRCARNTLENRLFASDRDR